MDLQLVKLFLKHDIPIHGYPAITAMAADTKFAVTETPML